MFDRFAPNFSSGGNIISRYWFAFQGEPKPEGLSELKWSVYLAYVRDRKKIGDISKASGFSSSNIFMVLKKVDLLLLNQVISKAFLNPSLYPCDVVQALGDLDKALLRTLPDGKYFALKRSGIDSITKLCMISREDLLKIRGFGPHAVDELESFLKKHGLSLASSSTAI